MTSFFRLCGSPRSGCGPLPRSLCARRVATRPHPSLHALGSTTLNSRASRKHFRSPRVIPTGVLVSGSICRNSREVCSTWASVSIYPLMRKHGPADVELR